MKKRLDYIDYIRFLAMTGVVYLHIASILLNGGHIPFETVDWQVLNFLMSFAYSGVALFFMISGCLVLSDERTADVSLLLKKRLPRLGIPLIAWTAAAALWIGHLADDYSIAGFFARFVPGIYGSIMVHFWFAFSIIALYLVSPLLYGGLKAMGSGGRKLIFALVLIYQLCFTMVQVLPENLAQYFSFELLSKLEPTEGILSVFLLGWYLGNSKKKIPNAVLLAVSAALVIFITFAAQRHYALHGNYNVPYHVQGSGLQVCLAGCLFLLFRQNVRRPAKIFELVPLLPLSYAIYFFHVIVMELFFGLAWMPSSAGETLLFTAANIAFSYLMIKTAASIKLTCYPATGLSYAQACQSCNWQYTFARLKKRSKS